MKYIFHFISILLITSIFPSTLFAEGTQHTETWNFGTNCRMKFEPNDVLISVDPVIDTSEGSASFSYPSTGDLLIYSDGITVWNKMGDVITTGLPGNSSAMHSTIIVPRPLTPNHVYVISHGEDETGDIGYQELDLSDPTNIMLKGGNTSVSLDGGTASAREGMLVVPHSNGVDYWIVVSGRKDIFVIPVTSTGLGAVSKVSEEIFSPNWGVFTISNDGTKLVMSHGANSIIAFDFDATTGALTNRKELAKTKNTGLYGGAFSSDDTKLYFSTLGTKESSLHQYDFTTGMQTIIDTRKRVYNHGAAKLAQNGKIYIATDRGLKNTLSVIENPNDPAASIDFKYGSIALPTGCDARLGLPQTISPFAIVAFGIEVLGPVGETNSDSVTPKGVANLPDGTTLTITVTGPDGFSETCTATVNGAKWSCAENAISGLKGGNDYEMSASDGTYSGTGRFSTIKGDIMMTDKDADKDGIPDSVECTTPGSCEDTDGDGTPDYQDTDSDGDGILDSVECTTPASCEDTDGDGTPDFQDPIKKDDKKEPASDEDLLLSGGSGCSSTNNLQTSFWMVLLGVVVGFRRRR